MTKMMSEADAVEVEESELPWSERVSMLSIHPDAATRHDVARLAAELMEISKTRTQTLEEAAKVAESHNEGHGYDYKNCALAIAESIRALSTQRESKDD